MTPQEKLRRALLNDDFGDSAQIIDNQPLGDLVPDKTQFMRNAALGAWMSQASGQKMIAGAADWQANKDAITRSYFKMPTAKGVSDDQLHGLVKSHIQTAEDAATLAADGALTGEPLPSVIDAVRGKRGASPLRPIFDRYEQDAMRRHTALTVKLAPYRSLVNQVAGDLKKTMEGPDALTPAFEAAADRLLSVPPEDRRLVLQAIGATGGKDAKDRASTLQKMAVAMDRMTESVVMSSAAKASDIALGGILSPLEGQEPDTVMPDYKNDELRLLTQQIRTVADQEIDPIKGDGWWSQTGIDVARMIPQTAVTIANPALGMAANWAYFENTIAGEAMMQDPRLTPDQARSIAGVSAPLNAAVETVTALIPFGRVKLPFVQKWLQATATSLPTTAARFGVRAAAGTAAEINEEYIQAWTPLKAQELLGALRQDMPDVDWENRMPKFSEIAAQTWGPALVFSLVGAGSVSISEVNGGRALAADVDLMVAQGLSPAKAQSIATAAESNNWQHVDTLFREDFVKPEKATDAEKAEATQRFVAKMQAQQQTESVNSKEAADLGVRVFRDAESWKVETAGGSVINADSAEAAGRIRDDIKMASTEYEAETMVALVDDMVQSRPDMRVELRPEVAAATGEGIEFTNPITGKTTKIADAKSFQNLRYQAAAVDGSQSDAPRLILGDNYFEFAQGIARVFRRERGPQSVPQMMTAAHEVIENSFRRGLVAGQWTEQDAKNAIGSIIPALESGILKLGAKATAEEKSWLDNAKRAVAEGDSNLVREVISELGVRTWIGRDRDGNKTGLRPGTILRALDAAILQEAKPENVTTYQRLRAWFKAVGAYLKGVVATAKIIRDAERNGTIDDFTGFLDKVLGLEAATREESEVKAGVQDMAFSLAPELRKPDLTEFEAKLEELQTLDLEEDQFNMPRFNHENDNLVETLIVGEAHLMVRGKDEISPYGAHELFIVDNDDNPIGFVRLTKSPEQISINMIHINEDYRGRGIGSEFYRYWLDKGVSVRSDKEITDSTAAVYMKLAKEGYAASVEDGRAVLRGKPVGSTFSLAPTEQDREYLAAVESGDLAKAQAMVDEAAKAAGYGTQKFYHGNPWGPIEVFDNTKSPEFYEDIEEDDDGGNYDRGAHWFTDSKVNGFGYAGKSLARGAGPFEKSLAVKLPEKDLPAGTKVVVFPGNGALRVVLDDEQASKDRLPERFLTPTGRMKKGVQIQVFLPNGASAGGAELWNLNNGKEPESPLKALELARRSYNLPISQRTTSHLTSAYLKLNNPKMVDMGGESFRKMGKKAKQARGEGHDALIVLNVIDPGANPLRAEPQTSVAVFSASQIKSADPVTRDESGQVIPLSQRFNPETPDIRFSLSPQSGIDIVSDTLESWQGVFDAAAKRNPTRAMAIRDLAQQRINKLGENWASDRWTAKGDKIRAVVEKRTKSSLDDEQAMREALRYQELLDAGMMSLTPETLAAWSEGVDSLQKHPFIRRMLGFHGRFMSASSAERQGKLKTDGKGNAGDYNGAPWIPPFMYAGGDNGIMPSEMAQNLYDDGMLSDPYVDTLWNELESIIKSHKSAKEAYAKAEEAVKSVEKDARKQAKAEAAAWRQEADDMQADDWSPRESLVRDMRVLNVALSAFPPEVRAKITGGSMVKLAGLATERARYKAIQKALEKAIVETEAFMRKEYTGILIKTLDKAAPIGKPGEVKKSKFIVTVQDEIDAINDMVGMDHDDVATAIAAAEAAIITAQTPEDADAKLTELNLLELFGGILDIKNTSSQEMASALEYLENIISQGRDARKMIDEARRERVKEMVSNAKREAYKGDSGPETTQAARASAAKKSGKAMLKKFFNELSGFDAVLRDAFGPKSKTAAEFSERFTLNSNRFEDVQNERRKRFRDFARELYRTKLGAKINQKLITLERIENASGVTYLKNRTVKTHKFTEEEAARIVADPKAFGFTEKDAAAISEEIQAIQETGGRRKVFTYEQVENEGDRTEIPLSQMDALYLSMALRQPGILEQQQRYGYDQETVDQLEKFLTDDAKRWRSWMQMEYDAGYNSANEVYMRMFNTRMPKITFYAPLMKNHQGQQAVLDPLNTGISSNSANPGSIKTRKARTSSLRIESAFSVFWSHFNQMEYWNANAEYLRDVQSVMLNPEVREAVVSAHGEDGMATISAWVQLQMSRGVGKAAMALASNKMFRNVKSAISMKALALSYTTTLKTLPSVFYSLGEIHMSKWPAALVSGMKHWDRLWKTNIIQRRLDIGGMPELRDLGSSALPMSWVNQGIRYGSHPTMYADGVFTTYSAAMAYGTSFDEAKRQDASDAMAHKYAEERTALIVSKTAQPESWTQKSLLENDVSGAGVLWTMFMSDPRQKMALTGEVLNQWRKGTATREEAARKFLAYWVIPGVMFQLANAVGRSLFKGDDDEWEFVDFATAALVGQFQGLVLFGSAIEMIISSAIAAAAEKITGEEVKRKPFWNSSKNPIDQAAQDLIKSGEKLFMEDGDPLEKSWEAAKSAGMAITPLYPAGAILSTGERVMKDTTNLFYGADEK